MKPAAVKCSSEGELCQFPFVLAGEVEWGCVTRNGSAAPLCSVEPAQYVPWFEEDDLDSFKPCQDCDSCSQTNTSYKGFEIHKQNVSAIDDCKELCGNKTECNYYEFNQNEETCILKYGVGHKSVNVSGNYFEAKNCLNGSSTITTTTTTTSPTVSTVPTAPTNATRTTMPEESLTSISIIAIASSSGAAFVFLLLVTVCCACKRTQEEQTDDDINQTYGTYEVPDPVAEVEDSNPYYFYEENKPEDVETTFVRDFNSQYGH